MNKYLNMSASSIATSEELKDILRNLCLSDYEDTLVNFALDNDIAPVDNGMFDTEKDADSATSHYLTVNKFTSHGTVFYRVSVVGVIEEVEVDENGMYIDNISYNWHGMIDSYDCKRIKEMLF